MSLFGDEHLGEEEEEEKTNGSSVVYVIVFLSSLKWSKSASLIERERDAQFHVHIYFPV